MPIIELEMASIVLAIIAGVVSKICYDWLNNKNKNSDSIIDSGILDERNESRLIKIGDEVEWLKEVHAKTDPDGLPLWYVPRELRQIAKDTSDRLLITNNILDEIRKGLSRNHDTMKDLIREIQDIKK